MPPTRPSAAEAPQPQSPQHALSALQTLIDASHASDPDPDPGASPKDAAPPTHPRHLHDLALQVLHNLQHQHRWTSLRIHTHSCGASPTWKNTAPRLLPRPLLSGLPPQRLYIHPDEQIALLQAQKDRGEGEKQQQQGLALGGDKVRAEREWVCPSQLREKWSLRRFGEVFDGIGVVPPDEDEDEEEQEGKESEWRTTKRVLLATVDDDSTVVYYIVHDGIVKPRQN
ncbi:hypothetical protein AAFC00_004738 [Neodothiora populina]